ncbi:hypothetical protein SARC_01653 [Sphaeroforma arctica JP610]|uniref:Uncharacterized protein n=1 Tax=Sphaeroforma arctica JP610 TaxID=667725 RepID=A0A0L0GB00_9EUKA|nr:hypothetical protein SARC_01653 [Sphaeroforma arctica JP610]KNC86175.1 hypothetical protein SARC_01653 [Sphaeroforma arctica JP610]|eukprot:XP_014160077.1 hypothetical protein SARC_01653 [Sphaeroforma arctica JP610]
MDHNQSRCNGTRILYTGLAVGDADADANKENQDPNTWRPIPLRNHPLVKGLFIHRGCVYKETLPESNLSDLAQLPGVADSILEFMTHFISELPPLPEAYPTPPASPTANPLQPDTVTAVRTDRGNDPETVEVPVADNHNVIARSSLVDGIRIPDQPNP